MLTAIRVRTTSRIRICARNNMCRRTRARTRNIRGNIIRVCQRSRDNVRINDIVRVRIRNDTVD